MRVKKRALVRTSLGVLVGYALLAVPASASQVVQGRITVYSAAEASQFITSDGAKSRFEFPGAGSWQIAQDAGSWRPMPLGEVVRALDEIAYPLDGVEATVIILPAPRLDRPTSSAEGSVIFLSPGKVDYPTEHVHVTVAHEMGHVVHHELVPSSRTDLWKDYAEIRGVDYRDAVSAEAHSQRLNEMFAEDFRVLFGGELSSGAELENHGIADPREVSGLEDFFRSLPDKWQGALRLYAAPNPFSGSLAIKGFSLETGVEITEFQVFDVQGRLVASPAPSSSPECGIVWDGRDRNGAPVAGGVYLLRVRSTSASLVLKVVKGCE